jgi:hypothetical protein
MIRKARRRRQRKYEFDGAADLLVFHFGLHALFLYARIMLQRGFCVGVSHAWATSCSSKFLDANPNAFRVGVPVAVAR